jgi:hypothetical protein
MNVALPSHKVPLKLVADIITFIAEKPQSKPEDIMAYTNKGKSYVTSGLRVAKMLEIISDDTGYNVQKEAISALGKTPSNETKINVMRKYIQQYEPFILFVQFCMNDNSTSAAARKVFTLYNFDGKDSEMLKDLFIAWGTATGIFKVKADKIALEDSIDTEYKKLGSPDFTLDDDMAIRLYIADRLGTELSVLMEPVDIRELTDAFKKYRTEPRDAIGCAGRAFENYLRRIAVPLEVDVVKKNGITQIIGAMQGNRKIHSKQNSVGGGIGAIRNMSGHGVDPKELEPWELLPQSALAYIELVISTIRSLHLFTEKSLLTF